MALTPQTGLWVLYSTPRNPVCLNHSQLVVDACAMHPAFHTCGCANPLQNVRLSDREQLYMKERLCHI